MRSAGSLLAVLLCACTPPGSAPGLVSITPNSGPPTDATPVTIAGSNLRVPLIADLDHGDISAATVSATIADVPLTDVVWRDESTIDATVPAGLPLGAHDVVVHLGARSATLENGYTVAGSSLTAKLAVAPWLGRGMFSVTMTVQNTGASPVDMVMPAPLTTSGTASVALTTSPTGSGTLDAGQTASYVFGFTASTYGDVTFSGKAQGVDQQSGSMIESPIVTAMSTVVEATTVATDPLGDGTKFTYVTGYNDQIYLGPNKTGTGAARLSAVGGTPQLLTFTFQKDTTGSNMSDNSVTTTSIGTTTCVANTPACGPDNEDGRGFFASGTFDGAEWLVIGGAKTAGDLDYVYMTTDTDTTLDFRYVDLSVALGGQTKGFSAAYAAEGRFYFGFPDTGGGKPFFLALTTSPPSPGLEATSANAINLRADSFTGWNTPAVGMIDSLVLFNNLLYVSSEVGIWMATRSMPQPYAVTPSDWTNATPSTSAFTGKTSRSTLKVSDLTPSDRAFPQMADFKGRLYVARNTTVGPQLWSCDPTLGTLSDRCEPGDWSLIAADTSDPTLTSFNDPSVTSISMVVATAQYLYVGFDTPRGVQIFRSSNAAPFTTSDFTGQNDCHADQHPVSCEGIGGAGVGDPASIHIHDAKALVLSTGTSVWVTLGNDTAPARLVVIP